MFKFFKKSLTYEDQLVKNVMFEIEGLRNRNPFKFLAFTLKFEPGDIIKYYTYIFKDGKLYIDDNDMVSGKNKFIDFSKYCYYFNGKPKNYFELEKYEFLFMNINVIKDGFDRSLKEKKLCYRIDK